MTKPERASWIDLAMALIIANMHITELQRSYDAMEVLLREALELIEDEWTGPGGVDLHYDKLQTRIRAYFGETK